MEIGAFGGVDDAVLSFLQFLELINCRDIAI